MAGPKAKKEGMYMYMYESNKLKDEGIHKCQLMQW